MIQKRLKKIKIYQIQSRPNNIFTLQGLQTLKILTDHPSKNDEFLKNSINIIQMSLQRQRKTFLEKEYLKKDGKFNMQKMILEILLKNLQLNQKGKKKYVSSLLSDLKTQTLLFLTDQKQLQQDTFQNQIFVHIKSISMYNIMQKKYHNQTNDDWYKLIITIFPTDDKDCYDYPIHFSKLELNEQQLNMILIDLQIHNQIGQSFESLKNSGINHNLIKEVLFADVKGLVENTPSIFFPSQGESIHLFEYEILSVEAFKKVENTWFMKIRKVINLEYASYGISKSQNLPNWMQLEYKNCNIIQRFKSNSYFYFNVRKQKRKFNLKTCCS
ncbi:hypothetical protein ABPG72_001876 [Tetrahymena utriculariae]